MHFAAADFHPWTSATAVQPGGLYPEPHSRRRTISATFGNSIQSNYLSLAAVCEEITA